MINVFKNNINCFSWKNIRAKKIKICWYTNKITIFYDNIYFNQDTNKQVVEDTINRFIEDNWVLEWI